MKRKWLPLTVTVALGLLLGGASDARASAGSPFAIQGSSAGASEAFFGYAVALDGDTAVVGAINDNATKGAAYVFVRSATTWSLQQELTAADGAAGDQFGYAVAISGSTAFIGAPGASGAVGAVYAFTRSGTAWNPQQEFTSPDGAANDCFGCALALSGTTAVVGAPGRLGGTGAAYLFTNGGTWSSQREFGGSASTDAFGFAAGLSPDANTVVVGAYGASNQGRAYILTKSGSSWSQAPQQQVIAASDAQTNDRFGYSVAAGNGLVLIGAYQHGPGAAYVFSGSGTSWAQANELTPSDGSAGDQFGYSVALSGDTAVVGAYEKSGPTGPGAAYVFTNTSGGWAQSEVAAPAAGQYFGYAVAAGPATAVVGAFGASSDAGAVYMFAPASVAAPALGRPSNVLLLSFILAGAGWLATRRAKGVRA